MSKYYLSLSGMGVLTTGVRAEVAEAEVAEAET
jgi:hypothetical protein